MSNEMNIRTDLNRLIYLDHASTTPLLPEADRAMQPYRDMLFGNPSAVYRFAGESARAVRKAREQTGALIGAMPEEIYFTSGGTESDNWALFSVCESRGFKDCHVITSAIEHHAVLNTCKRLEKLGVRVTYLPVDRYGSVDPGQAERSICPDTVLISVMTANNEIGTIEPVAEIGRIAHEHKILFHTDAVQAYGHIPVDVREMNIDMLSASAHKLGGPKGTGLLYVRKGLEIYPFMHGGSQERGRRSGTVNVPGVVGFGAAAEYAGAHMEADGAYVSGLRDRLTERILTEIPGSRSNGHPTGRLGGNAHFTFEGIEGETLLILLDREGICASSGSACSSGSTEPSHVLLAAGMSADEARGSLRLTISASNTPEEIDKTVDTIHAITDRLRAQCGYFG